jgi:hypothetical protein
MRKMPIISSFLLLLVCSLSAQTSIDYNCDGTLLLNPGSITSTNAAWLTTGNGSASGAWLGTNSNDDIPISTNNGSGCSALDIYKQKMIISKAGNVGIGYDGTNAPVYPENKLIVQNGENYSSTDNMYDLFSGFFGGYLSPSDVGIACESNTSTGINLPYYAYIKNTDKQLNIGYASWIQGDGDSHNQGTGFIIHGANISGARPNNDGVSVEVIGDGSDNTGVSVYMESDPNSGYVNDNQGFSCSILEHKSGSTEHGIRMDITGYGSSSTGMDLSINDGQSTSSNNYGINSNLVATTSGYNYGLNSYVCGSSVTNYGIYSAVCNSSDYAGYFNGPVFGTSAYMTSDPKLKENVTVFKNGLDQLNKLEVKNYTYKRKEFPQMNLPEGNAIGVMSTNLKEVFPNLVKRTINPGYGEDKQVTEFDAVNYVGLIPVLIEAVQELDQKVSDAPSAKVQELEAQLTEQKNAINEQAKQIDDLKKMLYNICSEGCGAMQGLNNSQFTDAIQSATLYPAIPNPTSGNANISYSVNLNFSSAYIKIGNLNGVVLKEFKITEQGKGNITLNAGDLAAGSYTYTLIIDNKVYDTKSLLITK